MSLHNLNGSDTQSSELFQHTSKHKKTHHMLQWLTLIGQLVITVTSFNFVMTFAAHNEAMIVLSPPIRVLLNTKNTFNCFFPSLHLL